MMKHVSLSSKSLRKVYRWCEENEGTPLADAYFGACHGVGAFNGPNLYKQLEPKWNKRAPIIGRLHEIASMSYIYRDTLGRMILEHIKRLEG